MELPDGRRLRRCEDPETEAADLVIAHTAHSGVDLDRLSAGSPVLDATYRMGPAPQTATL